MFQFSIQTTKNNPLYSVDLKDIAYLKSSEMYEHFKLVFDELFKDFYLDEIFDNHYIDHYAVIYGFHQLGTNRYYAGSSKSMVSRLLSYSVSDNYNFRGHISNFFSSPEYSFIDSLDNFNFEIYAICNRDDKTMMDYLEGIYVDMYDCYRTGFNLTKDGRPGVPGNTNKIAINNGKYVKFIDKDSEIPEGFKLGGIFSGFNNKGMIAINNGESIRYINKDEKIPEGFEIGGKPNNTKDMHLYYDENNIQHKFLDDEVPEGYIRGNINLKDRIHVWNKLEKRFQAIYQNEFNESIHELGDFHSGTYRVFSIKHNSKYTKHLDWILDHLDYELRLGSPKYFHDFINDPKWNTRPIITEHNYKTILGIN